MPGKRNQRVARVRRSAGVGDWSTGMDGQYFDEFGDVQSGSSSTADTGLLAQFGNQFNQSVAELDAAVYALRERETLLRSLETVAAESPDTYQQWQNEVWKIEAANSTIDTAKSAAAEALSWWTAAKASIGMAGVRRRLGAFFVIPWATLSVITGATAGIGLIIYSSSTLIDSLSMRAWNAENIRRVQAGLLPLPDSSKPQPVGAAGFFSGMSDIAKWLAIGFVVYMIAPPLLARLK